MIKQIISMFTAIAVILTAIPTVTVYSADGDFVINADGTLTQYKGAGGDVVIPDGVTSIWYSAFSFCSSITSVIIPDSVTSIGELAFYCCTNLTSITIPDSVTNIGYGAFQDCTSLTSITIGSGVENIDDAFYDCVKLTEINIDLGNTAYSSADGVFFNKEKTTLIMYPPGKTGDVYIIPDCVEIIKGNAFSGCTNLTAVTIPDSVTSLGNSAFYRCSKMTAFNVSPENTAYSSIDGVLFDKDITHIIQYPIGSINSDYTIPDGVKSIERSVFSYCETLISLTIPNSVTSIGNWAFNYCVNLTSITIPDSVTSIGGYAFYHNESLTSVTIPEGVTDIYSQTFTACRSLTSITIPDGVINIGQAAFEICTGLTSVTFKSKNPPSFGPVPFNYCSALKTVYVPKGSKSVYQAESGLNNRDIVEFFTVTFNLQGGTAVEPITCIMPNEKITEPTNPTREDYVFDGWYKEAACINKWDFNTEVTDDMTLYAKWRDCGHISTEWRNEIPVTCTTAGTRVKICTVCGKTGETETVAALKHSFPATWILIQPATCIADGIETRTCTRNCELSGYIEIHFITERPTHTPPADWTDGNPATCIAASTRVKTCITLNCNQVLEAEQQAALGHDFPEIWVVTQPATCKADGVEARTCTRLCGLTGFIQTRAEPAFGGALQISVVNEDGHDLIKISNPTGNTVSTRGLYLTDNGNSFKRQLPPFIIRPNGYVNIGNIDDNSVCKGANVGFDIISAIALRLVDADGNPVRCWSGTNICYCERKNK